MNIIASNKVEMNPAVLRNWITFEKIYPRLSPVDKLNFKTAFKHDKVVLKNMEIHDHYNLKLLCPACVLDVHSKNVPWCTAAEKRTGVRLGEVEFNREHLILRPKIVKWADVSTETKVEDEMYAVKIERAEDEFLQEIKIQNTRSTIGNIAPGDGLWFYDHIFGDSQFEVFTNCGELMEHFERCHTEGARDSKPDRVYRAFSRERLGEMQLRLWPLWDIPLTKDEEHKFVPWEEIRYHQFYLCLLYTSPSPRDRG